MPTRPLADAAAHNQDRDDHAAQRVSRSSSQHQPSLVYKTCPRTRP